MCEKISKILLPGKGVKIIKTLKTHFLQTSRTFQTFGTTMTLSKLLLLLLSLLTCVESTSTNHYYCYYTVKERKRIYIVPFYILYITQSAQAWITQFYLQIHHACLSIIIALYTYLYFFLFLLSHLSFLQLLLRPTHAKRYLWTLESADYKRDDLPVTQSALSNYRMEWLLCWPSLAVKLM